MNVLIVGLGSIGKKHLSVIYTLYPLVNVFALRSKRGSEIYENVKNIGIGLSKYYQHVKTHNQVDNIKLL